MEEPSTNSPKQHRWYLRDNVEAVRCRRARVMRRFPAEDIVTHEGRVIAEPVAVGDVVLAYASSWQPASEIWIPPFAALRIDHVMTEPLRALIENSDYGVREMKQEGFPRGSSANRRVLNWLAIYPWLDLNTMVYRLTFHHVEIPPRPAMLN